MLFCYHYKQMESQITTKLNKEIAQLAEKKQKAIGLIRLAQKDPKYFIDSFNKILELETHKPGAKVVYDKTITGPNKRRYHVVDNHEFTLNLEDPTQKQAFFPILLNLMESITSDREWNIVATVRNKDRHDKVVLAVNNETAQELLKLFKFQDKYSDSSIAERIQRGISFKSALEEVIRLRQALEDSPLNEFFQFTINFTKVTFQNKSLSDELQAEAKRMKRENKMHFFPYRHTVSEYTDLLHPFQIYHCSEPSIQEIHCFTNSFKILGLEEEKLMILY